MMAYAVAIDLAALGLGTLSDTEGGDLFVGSMPAGPDVAMSVAEYSAGPQPTLAPVDLPFIQVRVRGARHDPVGTYQAARAVYDALNGRDNVLIAPGTDHETWVIGCTAIQSGPVALGADLNGRHELAVNFAYRVAAAPTIHRPA